MSSTTALSSATSPFAVLTALAQDSSQVTQQKQMAEISTDLQNQLTRQLAALQSPVDQVSINISQNQIAQLQTQQTTNSKFQTQFGNNGLILSDIVTQLSNLSNAATAGDSTSFDNALSAANTDISILSVIGYSPLFQSDGVASLKSNGLNIQSSATYNLSSPSGQSAASADVAAAQNLVNGIFKINTGNQGVSISQGSALNSQITALQSLQNQQQTDATQATATETAQLTQNMQNQLHLIELNLGNTSESATMLSTFANPPAPQTSVFGVMESSIGETASSAIKQSNATPPILSLFA